MMANFSLPTPPNYEIHVFRLVRKLQMGRAAYRKQILRKKNRKELINTYIFVSASRLNLCFSSISFPKTNTATEAWTNMSYVSSSNVKGVEGDTRFSPFQVFITEKPSNDAYEMRVSV
jgi:hypothetical protein